MPVVNRVNETHCERGITPLQKITPHALRRTYISLMLEAGAPLPYVMDQVGHADSKTTSAMASRRSEGCEHSRVKRTTR